MPSPENGQRDNFSARPPFNGDAGVGQRAGKMEVAASFFFLFCTLCCDTYAVSLPLLFSSHAVSLCQERAGSSSDTQAEI